jgi:hypothetical protein
MVYAEPVVSHANVIADSPETASKHAMISMNVQLVIMTVPKTQHVIIPMVVSSVHVMMATRNQPMVIINVKTWTNVKMDSTIVMTGPTVLTLMDPLSVPAKLEPLVMGLHANKSMNVMVKMTVILMLLVLILTSGTYAPVMMVSLTTALTVALVRFALILTNV